MPRLEDKLTEGVPVVIAGFGSTYTGSRGSPLLLKVNARVISPSLCQNLYAKKYGQHLLTNHVCVTSNVWNPRARAYGAGGACHVSILCLENQTSLNSDSTIFVFHLL